MAKIRPFKALRFDTKIPGEISTLVSPPYDIINDQQYEGYIQANANNIIRLERPKGENAYKNAKELLDEWLKSGVLKRDNDNSIYIYEEEFKVAGETKKFKGFISLVRLEEFSKRIVLPHEETLSKAKEDRLNLMKATSCNFSQVYSLYFDEKCETERILDNFSSTAPEIEFTDSELVTHRLWVITDESAIGEIISQFEDRKLYIADGHHRYETAINYRNYCRENGIAKEGDSVDYLMMMLVDINNEGLVVFPTHRLIRNFNNFDPDKIILDCGKYFNIEQKQNIEEIEPTLNKLYDQNKKAFAFYYKKDSWVLMTLREDVNLADIFPGISESVKNLDVTVLHSLILEKVFGIDKENMANQTNLTYTRDMNEAIESVNRNLSQCAFIINPTRVTEIRDVALEGEKMPQKSTYFYPKIITGLVINKID